MKHMESLGHVLGETLLYEGLTVPYSDSRGKRRRYIIDFYAPAEACAWEIKPLSRKSGRKVLLKAQAASLDLSRRGIEYRMMDERDFPVLKACQVVSDPDVVFDAVSSRRIGRILRRIARRGGR